MLKILHTESSLGWGGQEIRILSECQWFNSSIEDLECSILAASCSQLLSRASAYNVKISSAPIGRKSIFAVYYVHFFLNKEKPDVVVTHSSTDSWLVAMATLFATKKPKIIRMRHVSAVIRPNVATKWLYSRAEYVVTTSEAIKLHIEDALGIASSRVISVPTGLDVREKFIPPERNVDNVLRRELRTPENALIVCMLSTLRSWKGHLIALEALMNVQDVCLLIIGDGPQEQSLKRQVASLGLCDRVFFMGYQQNPENVLHDVDIFIQPSFANEGLSQSLMQAMSVGLPVIASDIGGLNEMIEHGVDGYLVPPKDPIALSNAINTLAQNVQLRTELGRAARDRAIKSFSIDTMGQKMQAILESCISSS